MKALFTAVLFFVTLLTMQANDTTILRYLVREPKIKTEKTPVIILLQGVGSNEEDLFSFANKLPDKYLVISARAPFTLGTNSFAWYQVEFSTGKPVFNFDQEEKSRETIIAFIEQLKKLYSLNSNEIYLCGFSQRAIMSYSVALTRPNLIKGIAVMSGRLLEEIKPKIASKEKLQSLNVFISHGTNDNILQIQYAKNSNTYLKSLNIIPTFKEYEAGHEINNFMLSDLIDWLK
jgi:phospholipase/carboxylesterase